MELLFFIYLPDKQLWQLDGKTLINKANLWTSSDHWSLPDEETTGIIVNSSKNTILDVSPDDTDSGRKVIERKLAETSSQRWMRKTANNKGYFTLQNSKFGAFLTAASDTDLTITG